MVAAVVAAGLLAFAGCGSRGSDRAAGRSDQIDVVATTAVVADFVRNVGGDRVHVVQILKPGVDPHDYEASPADIQAIADADLVVKSGVGLEATWLDETVSSAGYGGEVVDASRGVTIRQGNGTDEQAAGDPHIWHDPADARIMVGDIAAALVAKDPAGKAGYERNAATYDAKLAALDAENEAEIGSIPVEQRKLVTNHDAFGYYVARYGLKFVGSVIPSFDSQAELSPRDITRLVGKIDREGVKAIFSESSLPPKTARAIGHEAGVKVVSGPDALYGDSLGPPGSAGDTYLKMEEHNTTEIVENLG